MRKLVTAFAAILALVGSGAHAPAAAGEAIGKIKRLWVRSSDKLHWVEIEGSIPGRPPCAAGHTYFMIQDETSDTGKSQFAMLLSASMSGRSVSIIGAGSCTRWGDGEDILTVYLEG